MKYWPFAIFPIGYALFVGSFALLLSGCAPKTYEHDDRRYSEDQTVYFKSICIDGVKYWMRHSGHKGYLAVRIDPKTLKPVNC